MAPAKAATNSNEEFLAACLKHTVEKPRIDFEKLSVAIGMSSGGAANKLRNIMKKWEEDGDVTWADKDTPAPPATPTRKPVAKRRTSAKKDTSQTKAKKTDLQKTNDGGDSDAEVSEADPPKKKAKRTKAAKKTLESPNKDGADTKMADKEENRDLDQSDANAVDAEDATKVEGCDQTDTE